MNITSGLSHQNTRNIVALFLYSAGAAVAIFAYWQFMTEPMLPRLQLIGALTASLVLFICAPILRMVEKWHLIAVNFLLQVMVANLFFLWRVEVEFALSYGFAATVFGWDNLTTLALMISVLSLASLPLAILINRLLPRRNPIRLLYIQLAISWFFMVGAIWMIGEPGVE